MKKAVWMLSLLLLLVGCSSKDDTMDRVLEFRGKILQAGQCSFDADVTADYGDKLYSFSISCVGDEKGDLAFTVQAPETISGITGIITDTEGKLTFDDVALQFDKMAEDQISPVTAPWVFLRTLRSGNITSVGPEDTYLRLSVDDSYEEDALHLDIWLDEGDVPQRAEILYGGRRILSLDVKNFQIQ